MRDYAKVAPQFWNGRTGKDIRQLGHRAQVLALYLITCPSANMIGLYYLPIPTIAHETGSPLEGASESLRSLCEVGFCDYDDQAEVVWVREMARFQIGERLQATDKRITGIARELESVPKSHLCNEFRKRYRERFRLSSEPGTEAPSEGLARDLEGPPKPGAGAGAGAGARAGSSRATETREDDVAKMWDTWLELMPTKAHLTATAKERQHLIEIADAMAASNEGLDRFAAVSKLLIDSPSNIPTQNIGMLRAKWAELCVWLDKHPGVPFGDLRTLKQAQEPPSWIDTIPSAEQTRKMIAENDAIADKARRQDAERAERGEAPLSFRQIVEADKRARAVAVVPQQ